MNWDLEAINSAIASALRLELRQEEAQVSGLSPMQIWEFQGCQGVSDAIEYVPPETIDRDRQRDDMVLVRSLWDSLAPSHDSASVFYYVIRELSGSEERARAFTEARPTPDRASTDEAVDYMREIALIPQSSFKEPGEVELHAVFSYADFTELAMKRVAMKRDMDLDALLGAKLSMLNPNCLLRIRIPVHMDGAPMLICTFCMSILRAVGARLLAFLD